MKLLHYEIKKEKDLISLFLFIGIIFIIIALINFGIMLFSKPRPASGPNRVDLKLERSDVNTDYDSLDNIIEKSNKEYKNFMQQQQQQQRQQRTQF